MSLILSLLTPKALIALVLAGLLAATHYGSYRVGRALVAGAWAQEREQHAQQVIAAMEKASQEQAELQRRVSDVDKKLQAEKSRRVDADRLAASSLQRLNAALDGASKGGNTASPSGANDPSAAIARECAGVVEKMDRAYRSLASQTSALQGYTAGVCVVQP